MTEALAELWHRRIREEWGFADEDGPTLAGLFRQQYRGSRYSWGYPACPDLDDQAKVAELLEIDRIGVSLTEEFHLVPEQSTLGDHRPPPRGEVLRRVNVPVSEAQRSEYGRATSARREAQLDQRALRPEARTMPPSRSPTHDYGFSTARATRSVPNAVRIAR